MQKSRLGKAVFLLGFCLY